MAKVLLSSFSIAPPAESHERLFKSVLTRMSETGAPRLYSRRAFFCVKLTVSLRRRSDTLRKFVMPDSQTNKHPSRADRLGTPLSSRLRLKKILAVRGSKWSAASEGDS